MTKTLLSILLIPALSVPAYSWGDEGHQIVARIAARHISDGTRNKIVALIRAAEDDDRGLAASLGRRRRPQREVVEDVLATIAIWPDHMPGGKGPTRAWHFIDIGLFEGPSHMNERCPDGNCV